jgi:NitT/TauT family transport system ATP-binding protein
VVPFARPRTIEMTYSPEFVTLTQNLRDAIFATGGAREAA